jgi:hypothetical protein
VRKDRRDLREEKAKKKKKRRRWVGKKTDRGKKLCAREKEGTDTAPRKSGCGDTAESPCSKLKSSENGVKG